MPFWGQRKIVNLAFWSLVISHFVTFHTLLMCVISRSHVTIWSCTLHWFTREDAECVPDHEPIRHRELLEALSFQEPRFRPSDIMDPAVAISCQLPRIVAFWPLPRAQAQ